MGTDDKPKQAPRRRWKITPWPYPGDSLEDKAKRIAISYRALLFDVTQARCHDPAGELHRLDHYWAEHGAYWPNPPGEFVDGTQEWFTASDLAQLIDKSPVDIYRWARRGNIHQRASPDGSPEYSLTSAIQYKHAQRQRRARKAST